MEIRGGPNGQVRVSCKEANRADIVLRWVEDGLTSCEDIARETGFGVFSLPQTFAAPKLNQSDKPNLSGTWTLDLKSIGFTRTPDEPNRS